MELTLMPDSQRYPLNLNLSNNVKDIIVFLAWKLLNSGSFLHFF